MLLQAYKATCVRALSKVQEMFTDAIMSYAAEAGYMHCDPHMGNVLFQDRWKREDWRHDVALIDWARSLDVRGSRWAFVENGDQKDAEGFTPLKCPAPEGYEVATPDISYDGPYSAQRAQVLAKVRLRLPAL